MKHNGLFIKGSWKWDKYSNLIAEDENGKVIDTIAELKLDETDSVVRSATQRLIANAPDMYSLLNILSKNLKYSNLTRHARQDIYNLLSVIDFGAFSAVNKQLTAYAPALLDLVKAVSEMETDTEKLKNLREKANKLIKSIVGGENE